jgi:hypothetical protein
MPPFPADEIVTPWRLYQAYAADEVAADKAYKGKVLSLPQERRAGERLIVGMQLRSPRNSIPDASGERYVPMVMADPPTPSGWPDKPSGWREVIRLYVFRPDDPLILGHGETCIVTGVCVGKVCDAVVLRQCYFSYGGGPDW